jgi:hypothetical protein
MTAVVWSEVLILLMGLLMVAAGIHIRVVAPAQRRDAWWTFGSKCSMLAFFVALWKLERDLAAKGANVVFTGWGLAVIILLLIIGGIGSVRYLVREVRQVSSGHTPSLDAPPET